MTPDETRIVQDLVDGPFTEPHQVEYWKEETLLARQEAVRAFESRNHWEGECLRAQLALGSYARRVRKLIWLCVMLALGWAVAMVEWWAR